LTWGSCPAQALAAVVLLGLVVSGELVVWCVCRRRRPTTYWCATPPTRSDSVSARRLSLALSPAG